MGSPSGAYAASLVLTRKRRPHEMLCLRMIDDAERLAVWGRGQLGRDRLDGPETELMQRVADALARVLTEIETDETNTKDDT